MVATNLIVEGIITAALGTCLIMFGLPYLPKVPKMGRNTTPREAFKTLFSYAQFFASNVMLAAAIVIRVIIYWYGGESATYYLVAAIPVGALFSIISLLFFRILMLFYGIFVGMMIGMAAEAGLFNLFNTLNDQNNHQWGKDIVLIFGLVFGGICVSRKPNGSFIRLVFAVAGAGLLASVPPCFPGMPYDLRRRALLPWLKYYPELQTHLTECARLATPDNQEDVYIYWGIIGALVGIPMVLFVFIPWLNRKFSCTAWDQDGFGIKVRFRPKDEDKEDRKARKIRTRANRKAAKKAAREAKAEERRARKAEKKNKGVSDDDSTDDDDSHFQDEIDDDLDDAVDGGELDDEFDHSDGLRSGSGSSFDDAGIDMDDDDDDSTAGHILRARIADDKQREMERIEVLGNKFGMFNKQREWLMRDAELEEAEKLKPPSGVIDWKRGTPDKVVPAVRILATRVLALFILTWGAFWLVWLIGFARPDGFGVIPWVAYIIAEVVNYVLGAVYNLNFWTPTVRKRKSLFALEGFVETVARVRVDTLIFHYKEDPNTTQRTLEGCLLMKRTPNCHLTHRICDDSFGQKRSDTVRKLLRAERIARGELPDDDKPTIRDRATRLRMWLKRTARWCMGGKRCPLPCGCCCCNGKRRNKAKEPSMTDSDGKPVEAVDDDFTGPEFDDDLYEDLEDDFSDTYVDNTISQADIDTFPFPEFDPLFYPLPEALQALQKEAARRHAAAKGFGSDADENSGDIELQSFDGDDVVEAGQLYEDVEKLAGEAGGLYDKTGGLLEPMTDRVRKIYEKNRRILRHLGMGKDQDGISYDFEPSDIGREVCYRVMEVIEVYLGGPVIPVLHFKEEMFREDCARGSLSVSFELRNPDKAKSRGSVAETITRADKERTVDMLAAGEHDEDEDADELGHYKSFQKKVWGAYPGFDDFDDDTVPKDRVKIVARIKPAVHHNKAGNVNNVLFNTEMRTKGQYVLFLDNDMRPEPDFLLYTLPWFYNEGELARHWEINDNLSFVQTPQIFLRETVRDGDKLSNGNQVFFDAIQPGRDGENACAFAGTNAIFSKRALLRIGGVPYESQTEDAHTSIRLHRDGFVSYYVNLPLVVGDAPTTVAARLLQYLRWVKGSIQLWWAQFFVQPRHCLLGDAPPKLPRDQRPSPFMLMLYAFDTMSWPLSALSALLYMFCALIFVFFGQAPLDPHDPFDITSFLWVFLPYMCLRMANNWIALQGVKSSAVWVAQEVWYSQAFTAFMGILDALYEKFFGVGLTGWKVTGEGTRTTSIEYFNVIVAILLAFGIILRLVLFLVTSRNRLINFGAAFFAGIILFQLWPLVSMSLYELLVNEYKASEEKKELGRFKVPNWLAFTVILIVGIAAGVLFNDSSNYVVAT